MGATYNNRNQLSSRQPGGALHFRGTLNEAATVTVQGKPAQVATDNSFVGQAQVPSGTSNVVVAATDPSGNTRTNTYQVTEAGSTTSYTYDANGNLTGDGTRTFEWDAENRLTAVKQGPTTLASFVYDGQGRRALKTASGVTTTYVYDHADVIEERLSPGDTLRYVRGPDIDEHWAVRDGSGVATYFLADHLGSVVQMTNAAGAVTLAREYDPYGRLLSGASQSGYAFTGREWDAEVGMLYYRSRFYDPTLGRFLSGDGIGLAGGLNLYRYVNNQPTQLRDPWGTAPAQPRPPRPDEHPFCYDNEYAPCDKEAVLKAGLVLGVCLVACAAAPVPPLGKGFCVAGCIALATIKYAILREECQKAYDECVKKNPPLTSPPKKKGPC